MDLGVSPELDAFWCYLIVILLGLVVAYRQVTSRLQGLPDVWRVGGAWILFFLYLLIPVGLFWILDRTGAIQDTSLFAALIVGIGYERILSGTDTTLQAPGGLSQFWSPFVAYANRVSDKIRDAARRNGLRLQRRLIAGIVADQERYRALDALAKKVTPDTAVLKRQLEEIDGNADLGDLAKLEQKADILYEEVSAIDEYLFEMKQKGIVTRPWYIWHRLHLGSWLTALGVLILLSAPLVYAWSYLSQPTLSTTYALWRLEKPNTSPTDRYRAARRLANVIHSDATAARDALARLSERMRAPNLTLDQVDQVLSILLEHRCTAAEHGAELTDFLVSALNSPNVDARARIHRALGYLAEKHPGAPSPSQDLIDWSPSDGDSVTDLQRRIDQWRSYWLGLRSSGTPSDCAGDEPPEHDPDGA